LNIFVYAELLGEFKLILNYLKKSVNLYIGNSDEEFDAIEICNHKNVNKIYAQNPVIIHKKLHLLPIGIENNMWFSNKKMINLINENKINNKVYELYVNLSFTHPERKVIFDKLKLVNSKHVSKECYIKELSKSKECVIIRGNGIDTHRFWESIYLNVNPVFYYIKNQKMNNFITNLKKTGLNFQQEKVDI
jgi:hypothetical protein